MTERKLNKSHGGRMIVSVLLPPADRLRLEQVAREEGRSMTNLAARIIAAGLDAYERQAADREGIAA
jgi:hypothetical protein